MRMNPAHRCQSASGFLNRAGRPRKPAVIVHTWDSGVTEPARFSTHPTAKVSTNKMTVPELSETRKAIALKPADSMGQASQQKQTASMPR